MVVKVAASPPPGQGDKASWPGEHGRADSSNTDVPEDPRPLQRL